MKYNEGMESIIEGGGGSVCGPGVWGEYVVCRSVTFGLSWQGGAGEEARQGGARPQVPPALPAHHVTPTRCLEDLCLCNTTLLQMAADSVICAGRLSLRRK